MGLQALNRLMSVQRERERRRQRRRRRRQRGQIRDAKIALLANGKDPSCQQDGSPHQGHKRRRYSGPDLPEDIWRHIHFMMPLQDAARAACVSHAFLGSWRCRPDITICSGTLGLSENLDDTKDEIVRDFNSKADQILKNHSGIGLKALKIIFCGYNAVTYSYLNNWLKIGITPELEELNINLPPIKAKYRFPCSLLSNGRGSSIQRLTLYWCTFRNIAGLYCLKKLTSLCLRSVHITENELGCLFSNSTALERLELSESCKIVCLKIPCLLQRLSCLTVCQCGGLEMIEVKAPNISSFYFSGLSGKFSLGESSSLQLKDMTLSLNWTVSFALAKLPFIVPNLEALSLYSKNKVPNMLMVSKTFLHLKHLSINLRGDAFSPDYDCFYAVSFLDAAPSLETLLLGVTQPRMEHVSFDGEPSSQNQIMGTRHSNLKRVKFTGFCSAKSLVELTWYILENAESLDCLTLDTTWGIFPRCSDHGISKCFPFSKDTIRDSQNALMVIRTWIQGKVPPSVKFNVLGLCSKCHNA